MYFSAILENENMSNKSIAILDFASEMNRGDAAMQEAIIEMTSSEFPRHQQNIVCVYGENQAETFDAHFDCSISHGAQILPGLRKTYNALGGRAAQASNKKIKNLANMALCYLQLLIFALLRYYVSITPKNRQSFQKMKDAEFVIWNGRNFRDRKGIGEVYDLLAMLLHPLYCILMGKKVFAIGVSIWPLQYSISRALLTWVLARCSYVTAREENALDYGQKVLGLKNMMLKPDLSYYFIEKYFCHEPKVPGKRVSLTLVDWTEDGLEIRDRYIKSVNTLVKQLLSKGYQIDVVPQVFYEWEGYNDLLDLVFYGVEDMSAVTFIKDNLTPSALFKQYVNSDFLIATRMHSAIFALTHRTPIVAIPYDSGGKWAILTNMGMNDDYIIDYQRVTPESLAATFNKVEADAHYFDVIEQRLPELFKDVKTNISDIKGFV